MRTLSKSEIGVLKEASEQRRCIGAFSTNIGGAECAWFHHLSVSPKTKCKHNIWILEDLWSEIHEPAFWHMVGYIYPKGIFEKYPLGLKLPSREQEVLRQRTEIIDWTWPGVMDRKDLKVGGRFWASESLPCGVRRSQVSVSHVISSNNYSNKVSKE